MGTVSRTCKKKKNSSYNQESERNCLLEDRKKKEKEEREEGGRKRRRNINNNYICTLLCVYLEHVKNRRQVRTKYFRIRESRTPQSVLLLLPGISYSVPLSPAPTTQLLF